MKKILFATTALVASAGVVAADVSFSGYGRFGAISIDNPTPTPDVEGIYTRIRLQIDMTTEADNGLTFGARLRHQATSVNGAGYGGGFNGARFFARAGGLEIGVGNTFGAIEFMPGVYMSTQSADIGLSGLGFHSLVTNTAQKGYFNWDAYSSGGVGRDGVEVMYSAGDFGGHLSYSNTGGVERTGLHVRYAFNDWTVALGYQDSSLATEDKIVLTVGGNVGPAKLGLAYADNDGIGKFALTAGVEVGAATRVDAYISSEDGAAGGEAYGLGVSHSLGGGASLEGGFTRNDITDVNAVDLGIRFNF
ncbi:porin [Aquicoccus porphyridii]|uniref:Porin n=1 Tax=Aquicoccus porphyridii TaxID=1852029 RepID=A0A5A9ZL70_9RHOB|nr:porin [Aquicoccus porphyridii]KAA0917715.1 porin [Aquicoccus porphyridii]RAI55894.1 porin [Rhodobacteraceae bacterium AsT-22]